MVFQAFQAAKLRWCVLRLPYEIGLPNGGDVDLLIAPESLGSARRLLEDLGFVEVRPQAFSAHSNFLTYHRATDCWIWLDIVTELSFGRHNSLKTAAREECLARCRHDGAVPTLAPDDDFWTLLIHCLVDKGVIAGRHRSRLKELLPHVRTDGPLAQACEAVSLDGLSPQQMLDCVSKGDWSALEDIARVLATVIKSQHVIDPWHMIIVRLARIRDRVVNLRRHRGLSVALMGPDGAGKTTLVAGIQRSFILPVRPIYMGLSGGLLRYIDMLHLPGVVLIFRLLVFWGRYVRAQYHQARGRLVLFDRYIYDAMVPHPERLNWLRRASRWVDGHACPGPDLVLVLDAPGEVMYARKREYSADTLEEWRHCFRALQKRFPQVDIVDTTRDRDDVRIDVVNRIWQRFVSLWGSYSPSTNQTNKRTSIAPTAP